eukprot:CAMPEP_0179333940 /NCGR_PEP_ID=MMETSP0797-20121207/65659_1 /TAXON_ID=47934 /ORGANISM="Dinophysis acuminata, Strain DAEP01" /LENGTH=33 /DNA_ID= /DNA_START= /DNA_END= /DNA_ORIENTATION=
MSDVRGPAWARAGPALAEDLAGAVPEPRPGTGP